MSSFPKRLFALAERLHISDAGFTALNEGVRFLDVFGVVDAATWVDWCATADEGRAQGIDIRFADEFDEAVDPESEFAARLKVRIVKPNTATVFHAFAPAGVRTILEDDVAAVTVRRVLVATGIEPFRTESCSFETWIDGSSAPDDEDPLAGVEPRRLIYDNEAGLVPKRIGHLLLKGQPFVRSPTFDVWAAVAGRNLPYALVDEVRGVTVLMLRGSRPITISYDPDSPVVQPLFDRQAEIAKWIYGGGPGIENRLKFFTSELARIWPENASWGGLFTSIGAQALEGAKSANDLLLSGKTGDVLKALGDLRKTMNDEVGRVGQQTRELSAGLWRDFVVAVTALTARAALSAGSTPTSWGIRLLLGLAAAFLAYSLYVTLAANRKTLHIAADSREEWTRRIYRFLSPVEMEALVTLPLSETEKLYYRTAMRVVIAYGVLIAIIALSAIWQDSWDAILAEGLKNISVHPASTSAH